MDCNSGWQQLNESNTTAGSYADQIICASVPLQATLFYDVLGRPNRFTVYEGASIVYNSGWVGVANYAGPWGQSLSTPTTGNANITFTTTVGRKIVVERGGASSANESDAVQFNLQCSQTTSTTTTTHPQYYYLAVRQCSDWDGDGAVTDRYVDLQQTLETRHIYLYQDIMETQALFTRCMEISLNHKWK